MPHIELDIGGVRQQPGLKAAELTRRNRRTIDRTFESDSIFENRKSIQLYVVNQIGDEARFADEQGVVVSGSETTALAIAGLDFGP